MAASAALIAVRGGGDDLLVAQGHDHAGLRIDPMVRLFIQESIALRREIKRDRLRGEHARRHAAALRMVVTYARYAGLDDAVRSQLRQAVRARGQDALLRTPLDYDKAVAELRAQGAVDPEDLPDPNLLTRDQRLAGLTELLRHGLTPMLARQAELVDRGASALDRYGSVPPPALVHVALRQDPISKEECEAAWEGQILLMKASAVFFCLIPALWELCVAFQLDILLLEAMQWFMCSDNP